MARLQLIFLAEQVFYFGGSWLPTGIPRQHFRACAWIEDKNSDDSTMSLFIARLFFSHHLHHSNYMPKKYTCTLQNISSTTSTASQSMLAVLLQLCLQRDSVIFTAMNYDGMKKACVSSTSEQRRTVKVQKEQYKTFLQSQTLIFLYLLRKSFLLQLYFKRNNALGRLRKKYLHTCTLCIISYLWHKHQ